MSEKEFNLIFSNRLRYYLNKNGMSQSDLAKRLGVGSTSVYNWINAIKTPRMDKIDSMCQIFGCKRADLMEESDHSDNADESQICDQYIACHDSDAYRIVQSFLRLDYEDRQTVAGMIDVLLEKDKYREKEAI